MDRKKIIDELNKDSEDFINEKENEDDIQSLIEERLNSITENLNKKIEQALGKIDENMTSSENEEIIGQHFEDD